MHAVPSPSSTADAAAAAGSRMTRRELRASLGLTSIVALRMLGLFLILPIFAVHAHGLPGGDDPRLVGLAMGIYGLTQAAFQFAFGAASDRFGRKPVIIAGLLLLAAGSFVAAAADDVMHIVIGRALQGSGAVSAAVSALVADSTRDSQRSKAMAMIGASIGLTFALSLVIAPALYPLIGMGGLFAMTGVLALLAIAVVAWVVPPAPSSAAPRGTPRTPMSRILKDGDLMRLNFGIFSVHLVQTGMFIVVPRWLVDVAGLPLAEHWKVYLPVVLLSFAVMMPPIRWAERKGAMRAVFVGSVALVLGVQLIFALQPSGLIAMSALLFVFFAAFNILEALLPSLVSRLAPPDVKGAALGVYNTTQSIGLFVGGALGGWVSARWGGPAVFLVCAAGMLAWVVVALGQKRWPAAGARLH